MNNHQQELHSFIQAWCLALLSLTYAYHTLSLIPRRRVLLRLLSLLPVIAVLTYVPLRLTTLHLGGPTSFFFIWLANSKLLLLAFHLGPLADSPTLLDFLVVSTLPVKLSSRSSMSDPPRSGNFFNRLLLAVKVLLLVCVIQAYDYRPILPHAAIYALYCLHLYLEVEIVLKLCAVPAILVLGCELEPQFDEPYLATSLQDFWGRRWNLMVTKILRPTVYDPVRNSLGRFEIVGKDAARGAAIVATFAVSGLMHEALYLNMTRVWPTWEVTWFFVLHGVSVVAEVEVKRRVKVKGTWRLGRGLTLGFIGVTGAWLFFPQLIRNGVVERVVTECRFGLDFVKDIVSSEVRVLTRTGSPSLTP